MKFSRLFLISILSLCSALISFCGGDNAPEVIECDKFSDAVFIRLNLPEELRKACQDNYWAITNKSIISDLNFNLETQENFLSWCSRVQDEFIDKKNAKYTILKQFLCECAFICYNADKKGYLFTDYFCKKCELDRILSSIWSRGSTSCFSCNTEVGKYLENFRIMIEYMR